MFNYINAVRYDIAHLTNTSQHLTLIIKKKCGVVWC